MKNNKIIAFIVVIVMMLNMIAPIESYAINQKIKELEIIDNEITESNIENQVIEKKNINEIKDEDEDEDEDEIKDEDDINKDENNENFEDDDKKNQIIENTSLEKDNETIIKDKAEEVFSNKELLENEKTDNENVNNKEPETDLRKTEELEDEEFSMYIEDNNNRINVYKKNDNNYLFAPKNINLSEMIIKYTGNIQSIENANLDKETKEITGDFQNESNFSIKFEDGKIENVIVMQSDVPAIFVNLNNDVMLNTVNSGSKESKYVGSINVTGCTNSKDNISQDEIEFKGRGNTSWRMPKKSYQIKLNKKTNFLGIGKSKEKKWVLVANYQDPTLIKNKIINDLCVQSELSNCPNCSYADLYVNGDYIGNYLVCDKIEIKENRINLTDQKGILVELDNAYYEEEEYYFQSKRGKFYAVKEVVSEDSDELIRETMNSFKTAIDKLEDELYSTNPSWDKVLRMIDVESFAKYYLINEFANNTDGYYSSCYFYKDGDNDVIHMGPTWDYDAAFGFQDRLNARETNIDFSLYFIENIMQRLYLFPEFAQIVNEIYTNNIKEILNNIDVNQMADSIKQSSKINTIVWSDNNDYNTLKDQLNSFVENRKLYYEKRYSNMQIEYSTHIENMGWLISERDGVSGTEGKSLRMEGIKIKIGSGYDENISVSYRSHVQDIGWQNWVSNGDLSGTTGCGLRLEAIQLKLKNSSKYSIKYRVHIQDIGWQDWKYDGETAGTVGQSKRIEAIEIQIVERKNIIDAEGFNEEALINYKGHIQDIGDTGYVSDGEILGTTGRELRLEALNIKLNETLLPNSSLKIDTHIQDIGWINNLIDGQLIGTQGKALRMEALRISLIGEDNYSIKYRVHIQDIGWQDWKCDGEMAGTEGQSKRIEAIQIIIVEKNT